MADIECSFCGNSSSVEEAKTRFIAGARAFVCRDCVDTMIDVFCMYDPEWREQKIKALEAMRVEEPPRAKRWLTKSSKPDA
jgi:hypothetical protein